MGGKISYDTQKRPGETTRPQGTFMPSQLENKKGGPNPRRVSDAKKTMGGKRESAYPRKTPTISHQGEKAGSMTPSSLTGGERKFKPGGVVS